jgi:hypothetical protein
MVLDLDKSTEKLVKRSAVNNSGLRITCLLTQHLRKLFKIQKEKIEDATGR